MGMDQGWSVTCRGSSGPAEVPTAAVYVGASPGGEPDLKERVGNSRVGLCVGVYCPEPLLGPWASGDCLFHMLRSSLCVWW